MNPLHLIWIIPLVFAFGYGYSGLLGSRRCDECTRRNFITEGRIRKGGINRRLTTLRPHVAPKGQEGERHGS